MLPHPLRITLGLLAVAATPGMASGHQAAVAPGDSLAARTAADREVVVLLHGLGRSPLSMLPLEWALEDAGYEVVNWGYSSICCSVEDLADELARDLEAEIDPAIRRVHFVGHSLGNIIIRSMLARDPPERLGRVVMLAPPNRGSEMADLFEPVLGWLLKPLTDLTTDPDGLALTLKLPPGVEVGIIAGEDDGKVSIAESHLPGEDEHVTVPSAHTFIMFRNDVHRLVTTFLRRGTFGSSRRRGFRARL